MRRLLRDESGPSRPIAEINLTNLIDVMMTLLIVFILIAPVIDQGFTLQLPGADPKDLRTDDAVNVVVSRAGDVHFEGRPATLSELEARARELIARRASEPDVILLADRDLAYGRVVEVMDVLRRVGLTRLALATKEP